MSHAMVQGLWLRFTVCLAPQECASVSWTIYCTRKCIQTLVCVSVSYQMVHAHSGSHICLGKIQSSDREPGQLCAPGIDLHIQCCLEPPICLPVSFITHPPGHPLFLRDENKTTVGIFIPRFLIQRSLMSITDINMCLILLLWKKPLHHRTPYEGLAGRVQAWSVPLHMLQG